MGQGQRLLHYIEKQGLTKKIFCDKYELEYNSMVMIMAEKRKMGIIVINRIHEIFPKLNVHWLLYGEGPLEIYEEISSREATEEAHKIATLESWIEKYMETDTFKNKIHELTQKK